MKRGYYNKKVRELQIRNNLLAILLAIGIGTTAGLTIRKAIAEEENLETSVPRIVSMNDEDTIDGNYKEIVIPTPYEMPTPSPSPIPTPIPTPTPVPTPEQVNTINRGDSVYASTNINLRLNTNPESYKLGLLSKGVVVNRIMTMDGWDLVRVGDMLAFVSGSYTIENDEDKNNQYFEVFEDNDIGRTTTKVNLRLGPTTDEKSLFLLDKDEEVIILGKAVVNYNSSNVWYIARARGQIGFIKADYVSTYKDAITQIDPSITNVQVKKVGYVKSDTTIFDENQTPIEEVEEYQLVQVISETSDKYLVLHDGKAGYILKNDIRVLDGAFISVDISDQRLAYYFGTDVVHFAKCTTGRDSSPTDIGYFITSDKTNYNDFGEEHNNAEAVILCMTFNGLQKIHDAGWENEEQFGDPKYRENSGSLGCIRVPDETAEYIYKKVPVRTPVLVDK